MNMVAYLEPAQFLGTLIIGVGVGIMLTRAYDAIQHQLRMRRIGRNVKMYAGLYAATWPPLPTNLTTKTSGPEAAPANRDPQKPVPTPAGVAVPADQPSGGVQSADAGEGVAPPARTSPSSSSAPASAPAWDGEWHTDWTDGRQR